MQGLLSISKLIDGLNNRVGHLAYWLTLIAVLVSSGNATVRYLFDTSSNAWLGIVHVYVLAVFRQLVTERTKTRTEL